MAIFKRDEEDVELTKSEVIENLLDVLFDDYEDWHPIQFKNAAYDLLLIKTVTKHVTRYLSPQSPNPMHKERPEELQVIIAITIDMEREKSQDTLFGATKSWTTTHIISDNVRSVVRAIKELDKDHK